LFILNVRIEYGFKSSYVSFWILSFLKGLCLFKNGG